MLNVFMEMQEWLGKLDIHKQIVEEFVKEIIYFSEIDENKKIFRTCGLYAVGSSVYSEKPNDIDITLVGLDFRVLFEYDKLFLQDPETLVNKGIVVPLGHESAASSLWEGNRLTWSGEEYRFNIDIEEEYGYSSIGTYCYSHIRPSQFVLGLTKYLFEKRGETFDEYDVIHDGDFNPLKPYNSSHGNFLGVRINLELIDFFIHGENLLVKSWKRHQRDNNLPFVCLYQWNDVNIENPNERYTSSRISLPEFIDRKGEERSEITPNVWF